MSNVFPTLTFSGQRVCNLAPAQLLSHLEKSITRGDRLRLEGLNVAKFVQSRSDPLLFQALEEAELVHVDGAGISVGAKLLGLPLAPRVAGVDLMQHLCGVCARHGWSIYLLGARPDVVADVAAVLEKRFPGLVIAGYRDGFFTESDIPDVVDEIARCAPKMLFIGISSPKKELFVRDNWAKLNTALAFGVGGSFDVVAGRISRAPRWVQHVGMEWAYRVLQEPRRLFWRYMSTNSTFAVVLAGLVLRKMTSNRTFSKSADCK